MASSPITSWQIDGKQRKLTDFFLGFKITADGDCSHRIKRYLLPWRKAMTNLDSILKSRDITLLTKVHLIKAMVFPVVMYGCDSWTTKKAEGQKIDFFWTVVLKKTLESPLSCKEIKPVNPKGNQSWIFIGRTDAEDEAPILWPPDAKSWLIRKDPDVGQHWRHVSDSLRLHSWRPIRLHCPWDSPGKNTEVGCHFLLQCSFLTLCKHMDCSLPGSCVHGIPQARILEWVAMPFSRGSSWPRDWNHIFLT